MGKGGKGKGGGGGYSEKGSSWKGDSWGAAEAAADNGGKKGGRKGGGKKGADDYSRGPSLPVPSFRAEPGAGICWNPADRDAAFVFLGRPFLRGRRDVSHAKWCGCRATKGIAAGRGAFALKNETGGNMRIGWSLGDATLELGMDNMSFGLGGTAMKSHDGKYSKFGQTYGEGDVIVALIDLERHALTFMKNDHEMPGDAFKVPRELWGHPFFPHALTKEATVTAYFGEGAADFKVPKLPPGFSWLADLPLVASTKQCDHSVVKVEAADAIVEVDTSKLEQAAHRTQFEEWKVHVNKYATHFQQPLAWEYEAERQSVGHRVKRNPHQLEAAGYCCGGLSAEMWSSKITFKRPRGIPRLAEISVGRTVLVTEDSSTPSLEDVSVSISGEVNSISETCIVVATSYDRLPPGECYRVDLGPNMSTYERIDRVLDRLQSCDAPSKKVKNKMGIMSPCTPLGDAIFADVAETAGAAQKWDPSTRPPPHAEADISRAARQAHLAVPTRSPSGEVPAPKTLNETQNRAVDLVIKEARRLSLVQGPPGTGKTTTAIEMITSWLRTNNGPVLATAFSNKGVNNLAEGLYARGVNVLRLGICDAELPYSIEAHLEWHGFGGRKGAGKGDQNKVIEKADVICATVIGSGMSLLRDVNLPFVVLDEAAQIIEPACLIPLSKGSVQVVMVGDQCQLPATVLSHEAQRAGLDVSMFDRLISMGMEVHMLSTQYRMHPLIAEFPSWRFYNHQLKTGIRPQDRPAMALQGLNLGTLCIVHVGGHETSQGMSKSNHGEADCVRHIVQALKQRHSLNEVGVITPYSAQVQCIRQSLRSLGREAEYLQVSSVDAFQGSEKEAILLSMVRSNLRGDIGFVADWRRLNVAVTRAKRLLVVVGNLLTLSQHALWRDFFGHHPDLAVYEWDGRSGLVSLSAEPARLLDSARGIAAERGVQPLPLRGDYPADYDFEKAERAGPRREAAPAARAVEEAAWDAPVAAAGDWGAGGHIVPPSTDDWGGDVAEADEDEDSWTLVVGAEGALLDLEPTRWGMRVEGRDPASKNLLEVGSTISAIGGQPLEQEDGSEAALDRVFELFGEYFQDGALLKIAPQEEVLLDWAHMPNNADVMAETFSLITEFCPKGLLIYGPAKALELARNAIDEGIV
eukprot:TRINITY_DN27995_c0_g1_i3.p1 TRINITY_DN27995_c0_g1~~TRINITY_DN27995_c0_g1_i3.p1  ORF type:complete len:1156 (+),score=273.93 TRINITY_DN27995_c0_g1_i3:35-3469(+)